LGGEKKDSVPKKILNTLLDMKSGTYTKFEIRTIFNKTKPNFGYLLKEMTKIIKSQNLEHRIQIKNKTIVLNN
jgi:hypothetical protein